MHANSRTVSSNQPTIHEHLADTVRKHASTSFLKPVSAHAEQAFAHAIHTWRDHGSRPLVLDAGCGVGLSTLRLAVQHPDSFVIGIDQSADRLGRTLRWQGDLPRNCLTVRTDLVDFWRLMMAYRLHPERHYLLYPNPWPKKRHLGRRWHGHPIFPTIVALGGLLECRSNWQIYIAEFASAVRQLTGIGVACETFAPQPDAPLTPFEQKYTASGHPLWRCRVQLPPPGTSWGAQGFVIPLTSTSYR